MVRTQSIAPQSFVQPEPPIATELQAIVTASIAPNEQERLRVILVGTPTGVTETIHNLHRRGFAEAGAWSQPLPTGIEDEVVSVLIRYRRRSG